MVQTQSASALQLEQKHQLFENEISDTELITAQELSTKLKVNLNQLYKLVRGGKIPVIKIGRSLRFQWGAVVDSLKGS